MKKVEFIVAEISKNWDRHNRNDGYFLREKFEEIIAVNLDRGYRLHSFALDRLVTGPDELNETIIAVFQLVKP